MGPNKSNNANMITVAFKAAPGITRLNTSLTEQHGSLEEHLQ